MGIDRIGKGGPPNVDANVPVANAERTGATFEVEKTQGAAVPTAVPAQDTALLDRLRSGQITVDAYVDGQVEQAVKGLGALPADKLDGIRSMLRERLCSDPDLAELFKTATNAAPPAVSDE